MKKLWRTLLLFLSLAAFLLLTPVVIFYALGYRTLSPTADPVPVGVVLVESEPVNGEVFVNGQRAGQTPEAISEIVDSEVNLQVAAAGYETWEKVVPIQPGQATEVRDIRLFPAERKPALLQANVETFSLSPNRSLLAAGRLDTSVSILDQEDGVIVVSEPLGARPTELLWAPESTAVLIKDARDRHWLLEVKPEAVLVRLPELSQARNITWHPRFIDRLLYISADNRLSSLDLDNNRLQSLVPEVLSYATSRGSLYVQRNMNEIERFSFRGDLQETISLPQELRAAELLVTPRGDIAFLGEENLLWVQDPSGSWREISKNAVRASWSPDGKMILILTSDNTLSVYNVLDERAVLPQGELQLVARLSRSINEPQWFSGGRHFIYQVQDEILITEIDTRDHPLTYQADTTNTGNSLPTVGAEGESIFYLKRQGNRLNLLQLPLLVEN